MFAKPKMAFVYSPVGDVSGGRAKNARKKRLLPSRMTKRFFKGFPPAFQMVTDYFVAGAAVAAAGVAGAAVAVVAVAGAAVIL